MMLTCPACRSPVDVPADHAAATIRCGICWAEIALDPRPVEEAEEIEVPVLAAAHDDPFRGCPGRTAAGMAPLEGLLRSVAEKMPHLFVPVAAAAETPVIFPAESPRRIERRRGEDDDLRRKRGVASSRMAIAQKYLPKEEAEPRPHAKLMVLLVIALFAVVFTAAYLLLR